MKHNSLSKSKVASVIAAILISSIHVKNESLKNQIVVGAVLSSFLLFGLVLGLNVSYLQPVSASNNEDNDSAEETTNTATTTLNETTTTITISSFTKTMRDLWVDHIVWTRQFIVDSASDLPSLNDTTKRLLKNQEDIGNAIKPSRLSHYLSVVLYVTSNNSACIFVLADLNIVQSSNSNP
jgi:hypothetical protein